MVGDAPRQPRAAPRTPPYVFALGLLAAIAAQFLATAEGAKLLKQALLLVPSGAVIARLEAIVEKQPFYGSRARPPPPPPPPRRPVFVEMQPDEVRLMAPSAAPHHLRCGEAIPPESITTTSGVGLDGQASVTVFVRSNYKVREEQDGLHEFVYHIEVSNDGAVPVQLMTRHWLFTDDNGRVTEVKGPGARGHMVRIKPQARLEYSSSTTLATARGAMHGSFQFEQLREVDDDDDEDDAALRARYDVPVAAFNAQVGRLALSRDGRAEAVPCADENVDRLPPTSVGTAHRLGLGATVVYAPGASDPDLGVYAFAYAVTISNARDEPVALIGHEWTTTDANGVQKHTRGGGLGGDNNIGKVKLAAGQVLSYRGTLELGTRVGNAEGVLAVSLSQEDETVYHVPINPFGLSVDDLPVPPIKPLGFLAGAVSSSD